MPRGTYLHLGDEIEERFHCAPGAGGWRYVADRADGGKVDLTVDDRWRQIRVQLAAGGWQVRGGAVGREIMWVRSGGPDAPATEHSAEANGFLGDSPAFLVAIARSLRLARGGQAEPRSVRLSGSSLATLIVMQRWTLAEITTYDTDLAPLPVERYEIVDLATGEAGAVHLAGDVVLDAPGIELADLDGPPDLID